MLWDTPPPVVVFVLIHRMLCLFVCSQILDVQMYLCTYLVECTGIVPNTIPTYLTPYLKEVVLCVLLGSSVVGRIHFGRLVLGLDV